MFKNTYQNGLLSIFYSCGANPLAIWDTEVKNGHIKRLTDNEVNSIVLEIVSTNVATTYITCPRRNQVLGIKLPFLVMIIKNLKRYFSFEITILDDRNMRRRFRISNYQSTTKIKPFCTTMPIGLSGGWNQIQFNLSDFTRKAYGTQFIETLRVQVHANARLRRIYFSERLYTEDELPQEYKLYLPLERKVKSKGKDERKEIAAPIPPPPVTETSPPPELDSDRKEQLEVTKEPVKEKSVTMVADENEVIILAAKDSITTVTPATTEPEEDNQVEVIGEEGVEMVPEEPASMEETKETEPQLINEEERSDRPTEE